MAIAEDIIRRADTVTILRCSEVAEIRRRAAAGEFDDYHLIDDGASHTCSEYHQSERAILKESAKV